MAMSCQKPRLGQNGDDIPWSCLVQCFDSALAWSVWGCRVPRPTVSETGWGSSSFPRF